MRLCHWHCRTRVACRSHTAFQDVLLLLLLAVVLAEINQKENVHLPLGSFGGPALVASHLAGRFTSEVLCGRVGVSEIGHNCVSCRHESKDNGGFPSFCGNFP